MRSTNLKPLPSLALFLAVIVLWGSIYIGEKIEDWTFKQAFTSLTTLKPENVSEVQIFNGESSQKRLLVSKSNPKDNKVIYEFVRAINKAEPVEEPFPFRQLLLSHELYLVINLKDSSKPIELTFYAPVDCEKTVYIDMMGKPGGAKSEIDLYGWLSRLGIWDSLGCD